ncbi:MFS transporter [Roseibium sp. M-1]
MKNHARQTGSLSYWQLFCFGALTTPVAMSGLALVMYIPTFYATGLGLGFTAVGLIFSLGRVFDVISDPVIGYLSDQTRSRFGPRKPWIILGVPCFAAAVWMLLAPPATAGLVYLSLACFLYFLFLTVLDIPYSSIGLEISPDVHERSLLAGSKAIFQVAGAIAAATLPVVFLLSTQKALAAIALAVAVLSAIGLGLFLAVVPDRRRTVLATRRGFRETLRLVLGHGPFRALVFAFFIVQSANSLTAGLAVLYITHVLAAPALVAPLILLLFVSTALFIPLWVLLSRRFGKKTTWIVSIVFCAAALGSAFVLGPGSVPGAVALFVLVGAVFGCDAIMPTSMLADIVYEEETSGSPLAGLFLAFKNAASKLTFIVPMAIAFPALDLVDFQREGANGSSQLLLLTLFFAGIPIALRLGAAVLLHLATIRQPASRTVDEAGTHAEAV